MDRACFDHYPSWIVVLSNLVGLGIWALGAFILSGFGVIWSFPYLAYCIWLEFRLLKHSCTDCYYYGRVCAFGKGVLCALLFRKGDPRQFANRQISCNKVGVRQKALSSDAALV
jgi:hypothetical protein